MFMMEHTKKINITNRTIKRINILFCVVGFSIIPVQFIREIHLRLVLSIIYVGVCSFLAFHRYKLTSYFMNKLMVDELTQVYNYRYFIIRLEEEMGRFKRYSRPLALSFIDCDNFKEFNDKFGHVEGNKALERIGQILKDNIRGCDVVARFGGDEFVVIFPEADLASARIVMDRVRKVIENTCFADNPGEITLSISIVNYNGEILEDFLAKADAILYKVKRESKNSIYVQEGLIKWT